MPPRALEPSGLVLVDKPAGPSSFAIVRRLRNQTGARAGHTGTLDPFATGLLLVLLGAATRLARYLSALDKRYLTTIDLRRRTSTGDSEGQPEDEHEPPSADELARALAGLRGEVSLPLPAASAVKIGGERAYRLARRGVAVAMPERRSMVHALRLERYQEGVAELDLRVSSGTYVRAIAAVLGGHCVSLRRLEVGPFRVGDADETRLLPPAEALAFLAAVELDGAEAAAVRAGRTLSRQASGAVRLLHEGRLVAVGRGEGSAIRPETVMPS
jgi:tRNA pseudouridine55 synthase